MPRAVIPRGTHGYRRHVLSFPPRYGSEVLDDGLGELGNVRREAGRGEIESQDYADRGVPYFQARVFAQQEYHRAAQQRHGNGYRQSITPFPSGPGEP
jgi:hypothetical protein